MDSNKRQNDIKKIIGIVILLLLILVDFFILFAFSFPAKAGFVEYETNIPQDFDIEQAQEILEQEGYICELEQGQIPHLLITRAGGGLPTHFNLLVDEENDIIHIDAHNDIRMHSFEVILIQMENERSWQEHSEGLMGNIISELDLPNNGTYSYRNEIDSSDYSVPFTVFYITMFVSVLIVVGVVFFSMILVNKSQTPPSQDEPQLTGQTKTDFFASGESKNGEKFDPPDP